MRLRDRLLRALVPPEPVAVVREDVMDAAETRNDAAVQNALTGLGGASDRGSAFSVVKQARLSHHKLDTLYAQDGLVRRIVDIVPTDAMRPGFHLQGLDDTKAFDAWATDFNVEAKLARAGKMARLHGGALLWPVVDGIGDAELRKPRQPGEQGRVVALHVIDGDDASPARWSEDLGSKHCRMPEVWHVHIAGRGYQVHTSRLVWVRGLPLAYRRMREQDRWPDGSLVQACWDAIGRLTTTVQAGSVLAHNMQSSTLKVGGLARMDPMAAGVALRARLKELVMSRNLLGAVVLGDGDEFHSQSHAPTGFKELSSEQRLMVSAVTGIPQTRLFGEAPGGLSTDNESGRDSFDRTLSDEQVSYGRYLLELLDFFDLGLPDDGWTLGWGPLSVPSLSQQVAAYKDAAAADAAYFDRGVLTSEEIRASRFGEGGWVVDVEVGEEEDLAEKAAKLIQGADPDAPDPVVDEPEKKPINGAQTDAVLRVIDKAVAGGLTRNMAQIIMSDFLRLDPAPVSRLLDDLGNVELVDVEAKAAEETVE